MEHQQSIVIAVYVMRAHLLVINLLRAAWRGLIVLLEIMSQKQGMLPKIDSAESVHLERSMVLKILRIVVCGTVVSLVSSSKQMQAAQWVVFAVLAGVDFIQT